MKTDIVISELKVGDPLFSTIHREVEVVGIDINSIYPIKFKDKFGTMYIYSLEGKAPLSESEQLPSLFKVSPFKEVERVVMVKDFNDKDYMPRVLMAIKNKKAICWADATNIEDAKNKTDIYDWDEWKEVDPTTEFIHLTLQDISNGKGVGIDPTLIKIK